MTRPIKYFNDEERQTALKNSKTKYMLNKPWYCYICDNGLNYKLAGKFCHLKTKKHKHNHDKYISNLKINIII